MTESAAVSGTPGPTTSAEEVVSGAPVGHHPVHHHHHPEHHHHHPVHRHFHHRHYRHEDVHNYCVVINHNKRARLEAMDNDDSDSDSSDKDNTGKKRRKCGKDCMSGENLHAKNLRPSASDSGS